MTTMRSTLKSLVMAAHCWGLTPLWFTKFLLALLGVAR